MSPSKVRAAPSDVGTALRKLHVGEQLLLRQFRPHSVPQAYRRNWKKLNGGTHHANLRQNRCDIGRYRRNRGRQFRPSRSLVRVLFSSVLPSSLWLLPLLSTSLLRLLPVLPSLLAPLAPLVLARSFLTLHRCSCERQPYVGFDPALAQLLTFACGRSSIVALSLVGTDASRRAKELRSPMTPPLLPKTRW